MKEKKMTIRINCFVNKAFEIALNPNNTPLWINTIIHEEADESPPRLGTVYRNLNKKGKWTEYRIVKFRKNRFFEMKQKNGTYHVRYTYEPISNQKTKLTYKEWVEYGKLAEPFQIATLRKFKHLAEEH